MSRTAGARPRVTLERTFRAAVEDVWELWTTKDGIESWWGPEGFEVEVLDLDLRPGGALLYAMSAVAPDQVAFLKQAGMPVRNEHRLTYDEVVPNRRLAYRHVVDFVPGASHYEVVTEVDLETGPHGVRMVLTFDAMHDEQWTRMATMGWESELGRLAGRLEARAAG